MRRGFSQLSLKGERDERERKRERAKAGVEVVLPQM